FFIPGTAVAQETSYRMHARAKIGPWPVIDLVLGSHAFRRTRTLGVVLAPQAAGLDSAHRGAVAVIMREMDRMYPLADGVGELAPAVGSPGLRYTVAAPLGYLSHLDPADFPTIAYEDGFLLRDHAVLRGPGAPFCPMPGSDPPVSRYDGTYLAIDFTWPQ